MGHSEWNMLANVENRVKPIPNGVWGEAPPPPTYFLHFVSTLGGFWGHYGVLGFQVDTDSETEYFGAYLLTIEKKTRRSNDLDQIPCFFKKKNPPKLTFLLSKKQKQQQHLRYVLSRSILATIFFSSL